MDAVGRHGGHPEVVDVRLFDHQGVELPRSIESVAGWPTLLKVRFVDAEGTEIPDLRWRHRSGLRWSPIQAVMSDNVAGEPFEHWLTVTEPCAGAVQLRVGYGHAPFADERFFGPFIFTTQNPVASARLFDSDGVEITNSIAVSASGTTRLEVRFYDCEDQPVTTYGETDGIRLFWAPEDLLESAEIVEVERFVRDIQTELPAGTEGEISIGFGSDPTADAQIFGPFPLVVVP